MEEKKLGKLKSFGILALALLIGLVLLVIFPFWFLFTKIVNFVNIKGIRRIGGNLQTPVVFYEHPVTKRVVVFMATIHVADPSYFADLQRLIDTLTGDGYTVLFEGVGKLTPEEEKSLTEKEQTILKQFDYLFCLLRDVASVMSLQHQGKGLAYSPSWVNTDMRYRNLIRLFADRDITFVKKVRETSIFGDDNDKEISQLVTRWVFNKAFLNILPIGAILYIASFFSRNRRLATKVILDARNDIAFQGIVDHTSQGNVVTIWGGAHLRGIEKRLKTAGFRAVRQEWFTAYSARKYSFLDCIKKAKSATKVAADAITAIKKD